MSIFSKNRQNSSNFPKSPKVQRFNFSSFCVILHHFASLCFILLHFSSFCFIIVNRSASRVSPATRYSRVFASFCLILASFRLILSHFGFFWPSRGRAKSQHAIASEWAENTNLGSPTGVSQPGRIIPSLRPNLRALVDRAENTNLGSPTGGSQPGRPLPSLRPIRCLFGRTSECPSRHFAGARPRARTPALIAARLPSCCARFATPSIRLHSQVIA